MHGAKMPTMPSRSEEFRAHAAECRALATSIRDLALRQVSQQLARQWLELAEHAERRRAKPDTLTRG
jgi:hypothetical protein